MKKLALALGAALLWCLPAQAQDVPADVQVKLQNAMQSHLDEVSKEGAYSYLTSEAEVRTLYPANTHPMVLAFGEDYFVCADMVDDAGQPINADFLVREIGGDYRVVQMLVDQRMVVRRAMGMTE